MRKCLSDYSLNILRYQPHSPITSNKIGLLSHNRFIGNLLHMKIEQIFACQGQPDRKDPKDLKGYGLSHFSMAYILIPLDRGVFIE